MSDSLSKGRVSGIIILLILTLGVIHSCAYWASSTWTGPVTVTKAERIISGSGENTHGRYMVWTDKEVFEVTDTLLFTRWDSADTYGQIQVGKTYRFKVAGWRFGCLSWNRNILEYEEISSR